MKNLNSIMAFIAIVVVVSTSACKRWGEEPGGGGGTGGGGNNPKKEFTEEGCFRDYKKLDGCNWVFETTKGEKYEVGTLADGLTIKKDVKATINFSYSPNSFSVCMVGAIIDIKAIKYNDTPVNNCKEIIKGKSPDKKQTVQILNAKIDGNKLLLNLGFSGCDFKTEPINLYLQETSLNTKPVKLLLKLGNLPEEQACNAYFTKSICFDLSSITQKGLTYSIMLNGYENTALVFEN